MYIYRIDDALKDSAVLVVGRVSCLCFFIQAKSHSVEKT